MIAPLVSVIIPCYNYGHFLAQALESVQQQSHSNWECIIVDNGSIDNTRTVCKQFIANDPRFRYLYTTNNGVSAARNLAIKNSNGKYILPLDADDFIGQTYIEKAVAILEKENEVKVVYCKAEFFGDKNGRWYLPEFKLKKLLMGNTIFCTSLFRRSDFNQTSGFNENMRTGFEDWDFWLSILENGGKVFQIPDVLFYYRIRKESRNNSLSLEMQKELRIQLFHNHRQLYNNHHITLEHIEKWYITKKNQEVNKEHFFNKSSCAITKPLRWLRNKLKNY